MKHVCAWCGCETAPPDGKNDHLTTHGICKDCQKLMKAEFEAYQLARQSIKGAEYGT